MRNARFRGVYLFPRILSGRMENRFPHLIEPFPRSIIPDSGAYFASFHRSELTRCSIASIAQSVEQLTLNQ